VLQTISETAVQVRHSLEAADEREALRWVAQFVTEFRRAAVADRPSLIRGEPPTTGDRRWDALLAGVVEHLCFHHGLPVPDWVVRPARFLDRWWFVTPYRSLHASAFAETPAALANRGVFIHSVDEALAFVQDMYPHQPIPPRSQYLLEELFPRTGGTKGSGDASE